MGVINQLIARGPHLVGPVCVHCGALASGETYSEALVETGGEKVPKVR